MGVDFITLLAQIVNLAILIWLLKKFLYKPLLDMIDARQAKILKDVQDAQKAAEAAKAEEAVYAQKVEAFEKERQVLLKEATEEAQKLKSTLSEEARQTVSASRERWKEELILEKKSFDLQMRNAIVNQFKLFATKALSDMADVTLQTQIEKQFQKKLKTLSVVEKKRFLAEAEQTGQVHLTAAFDKPSADLKKAVQTLLKLPSDIRFITHKEPTLICGLELHAGESTITWNLAGYLEDFSSHLDATLSGTAQIE